MKTYEEMIYCEARMEIADEKKIRENFLGKHEVTRFYRERKHSMNTYQHLIHQAAEIHLAQKYNAKRFNYTKQDRHEDVMFMQGYLNAIHDMFEDDLPLGIDTVREDVRKKITELQRKLR